MAVVDGVPELEREDGVGSHLLEFSPQLVGSQSVLVEAVVPCDPLQHLDLAAEQPVSALVDELEEELFIILTFRFN